MRWAARLAVAVLGLLALSRMPLGFAPGPSRGELSVELGVGQGAPSEAAHTALVELEAKLRGLGGVAGWEGTVTPEGARLWVELERGTDVGLEAIRLESELAELWRDREGIAFAVEAAAADLVGFGGSGPAIAALVWVDPGTPLADVAAARLALEAVPGVGAVEPVGFDGDDLDLVVDERHREEVTLGLQRAFNPVQLGSVLRFDGRLRPLATAALDPAVAPSALAAVPVAVDGKLVPLAQVAQFVPKHSPAPVGLRRNGGPVRALVVSPAPGASVLGVDRGLRRVLDGVAGRPLTVGWSAADALRELLWRLGLGLGLAAGLGGLLATRYWGPAAGRAVAAAPLVLGGGATAVLAVAGVGLDLATALAAVLAVGIALVVLLAQFEGVAWLPGAVVVAAGAAVAGVLVTVLPGSENLERPFFAFALACGVCVALVPLLVVPRDVPTRPKNRRYRFFRPSALLLLAFRDPTLVLLGAAGAATVAIVAAGSGTSGPATPASPEHTLSDATVVVRLPPAGAGPAGPSAAPQLEEIERVERAVAAVAGVGQTWTVWLREGGLAVVGVRATPAWAPTRQATAALQRTLRDALAVSLGAGVAYEVGPPATDLLGAGQEVVAPVSEAARDGSLYRVVVRAGDPLALARGEVAVLEELGRHEVRSGWIVAPKGTTRLLLDPGSAAAMAASVPGPLAALVAQAAPPATVRLATFAPRALRVVRSTSAAEVEHGPPQLDRLLERVLPAPGDRGLSDRGLSGWPVTEEVLPPARYRANGRYAQALTVHLPWLSEVVRRERQQQIDRALGRLGLPAGVSLERPVLRGPVIDQGFREFLGAAAAIAAALLLVAAVRLGSWYLAPLLLVPPAAGLLAAAPWIARCPSGLDGLCLLALGGAGLALLWSTAEFLRGSSGLAARTYRAVRSRFALGLSVVTVLVGTWVVPLWVWPASSLGWLWGGPLVAGGVVAVVGLLALGLVVAPLAVVVHRWRRADRTLLARSQQPPQWQPDALASCPPTLAVCRLTKVYPSAAAQGTATGLRGGFRALDAASFRLGPGITGLLGPNGAGKSTLLRILAGLVEPTRGGVELAGVRRSRDNRAAYRSLVGYVPQDLNAYQGFTAREFLDHWALARGLDAYEREHRIALALEAVDLAGHADRRVRDFSGGMRRRVGVAQALLGAPRILVLDEPTAGLDITARGQFRELLQGLAADRIVLVSTHIASDLEALARYVVVVGGGQVRFEGSVDALVASARGRVFRALVPEEELRAFSRTFATTSRVRTLEGFVVRAVAPPDQPCEGEVVEPNLEEAYLVHIGARRQPAKALAVGSAASVSV